MVEVSYVQYMPSAECFKLGSSLAAIIDADNKNCVVSVMPDGVKRAKNADAIDLMPPAGCIIVDKSMYLMAAGLQSACGSLAECAAAE